MRKPQPPFSRSRGPPWGIPVSDDASRPALDLSIFPHVTPEIVRHGSSIYHEHSETCHAARSGLQADKVRTRGQRRAKRGTKLNGHPNLGDQSHGPTRRQHGPIYLVHVYGFCLLWTTSLFIAIHYAASDLAMRPRLSNCHIIGTPLGIACSYWTSLALSYSTNARTALIKLEAS
jgi:hypothetical protein